MPRLETADMIARTRLVTAEALFDGRADLHGYPFRLLGVVAQRGAGLDTVSTALAAAEMLLPFGWELVNVAEFTGSRTACAFLRRAIE